MLTAPDRRAIYTFVDLDTMAAAAADLVEPIRNLLGETQLDVWVTDDAVLAVDLGTYSEAYLRRDESIAVLPSPWRCSSCSGLGPL